MLIICSQYRCARY